MASTPNNTTPLPESGRVRPLLIYDGDCGFCTRWVARWQGRTAGRVEYAASQNVAGRFPQIPPEAFANAVQLVELDGAVFSGAHAVFRLLSHAPRGGWMLWCYEHVPGAAVLSERAYRAIARNRGALSTASSCTLPATEPTREYRVSRWIFMRLLGMVYLIAFGSLSTQIIGLVGDHGILPARRFLEAVHQQVGSERFLLVPTAFWIHISDAALRAGCFAGIGLSILLLLDVAPALILFLLWALYLSLTQVGQTFLAFQWDNLLLETGLLALFIAPLHWIPGRRPGVSPSRWGQWLMWWLLFRFMFASGIAKLTSGDPTWRDFSALSYHFETQPLPPWVAWYFHHLPATFQKASVAVMFICEVVLPLFIFGPRVGRIIAVAGMVGLQLLISITGNYGFFNLLTVALCVLLLDDGVWPDWVRQRLRPARLRRATWPARVVRAPVAVLGAGFLVVSIVPFLHAFRREFPPLAPLAEFHRGTVEPFRSINGYGLFATMTTSRPEIIVEGSEDGRRWRAYEFRYKPGDLGRRPAFVQPHMPRLDWQMWFAALSDYRSRRNQWFVLFCQRLLEGSPEALALMASNPFPDRPPHYLRAVVYNYHFSDADTRARSGHWWTRTRRGLYLPVLTARSFVRATEGD